MSRLDAAARLDIERAIVRKLIRILKAAGYLPSQVWDGDEYVQVKTEAQTIEAVFAVDEATIHFDAGKGDNDHSHGVLVILGNWVDCISDYHISDSDFDKALDQFNEWMDDEHRQAGKIACPKCSYLFAAACGTYGCPNCLGEGLE